MNDITQGVARSRAWPRKRGPATTRDQRDSQDKFRQAQMATKYWQPDLYSAAITAVQGTPLLPRDIMTMIMYNRLTAFDLPDGKTLWPMPARNDVSQSLDAITQTEGYVLVRGKDMWTGMPWDGGGGTGGKPWWWKPPLASSFQLASGDGNQLQLSDDTDVGLKIATGPQANVFRIAYRPIEYTTLDWTFTVRLDYFMTNQANARAGIGIRDSASGRLYFLGASQATALGVYRDTNLTTFNSTMLSAQVPLGAQLNWLQIRRAAAAYSFWAGPDGKQWVRLVDQALLGWLPNPADQICLTMEANPTTGLMSVGHFDFIN